MKSRDFSFALAAAIITAVFLQPTLSATKITDGLPVPLTVVLIGFVIISIIGMYIVTLISKKLAILWQIAKFGQIGVLNTAVDFGILNILISYTQITSGVGIIFINVSSFLIALVNSYFWNKNWVFSGTKKSNFITFATVTLIGLSANTGIVYVLTTYVTPVVVDSETLWANFAKLLATVVSLIWNFTGYKLIVFKKSSNSSKVQL